MRIPFYKALASIVLLHEALSPLSFNLVQAFSKQLLPSLSAAITTKRHSNVGPSSPSSDSPKVLQASDVLSRSKQRGPLPYSNEELPQVFSQEIYRDFQSALLKLEKRVKEGQGSLNLQELQEFEDETGRIVMEMNDYLLNPQEMKLKIAHGYPPAEHEGTDSSTFELKSNTHTMNSRIPPTFSNTPSSLAFPTDASNTLPTTPRAMIPDTSNEEGPAFDGEGGYGLARGTTNTYLIPGMEEMSPEEYRAKLQETISARQAKRREESLRASGGTIGNRSSTNYLDQLNRTGGSEKGENQTVEKWKSNSLGRGSELDAFHENKNTLVRGRQELAKEYDKDSVSFKSKHENTFSSTKKQSFSKSLLEMPTLGDPAFSSSTKVSLINHEHNALDVKLQPNQIDSSAQAKSETVNFIIDSLPKPFKQGKSDPNQTMPIGNQQPIPSSEREQFLLQKSNEVLKQSKVREELDQKSDWQGKISIQQISVQELDETKIMSQPSFSQEEKYWINDKRQRPPSPATKLETKIMDSSTVLKKISNRNNPIIASSIVSNQFIEGNDLIIRGNSSMILKYSDATQGKSSSPKAESNHTRNSLLRSLLKDTDKKIKKTATMTVNENHDATPTSQGRLTETKQWWNERTNRPTNYVKHYTPLSTTYETRAEYPRNYGDMILSLPKDLSPIKEDDDVNPE